MVIAGRDATRFDAMIPAQFFFHDISTPITACGRNFLQRIIFIIGGAYRKHSVR
jgi:hypothetical protein